ncbi:hypothetical protein ACFPMF_10670 [Larkinella bovis]|uniref:Uncharacterized protein n=1 Tax=Larkinella bovis TaxID=683041 RepID=A0ABW0IB48_9BACT
MNASKPVATASEATKRYTSDKKVLFFDDLSTTAAGGIPANWFLVKGDDGNKPTVVEVSGAPGKWLRLKKHAYPTNFTQPLSGDFTLTYDVLVQKGDVPWGTPGMQLQFYTEGQPNSSSSETSVNSRYRFSIDVSPGDMNRNDAAGWLMIGNVMPQGYFKQLLFAATVNGQQAGEQSHDYHPAQRGECDGAVQQ